MTPFAWFATGLIAGMILGALLVLVTAWIIAEWCWRRDEARWESENARPFDPSAGLRAGSSGTPPAPERRPA